MKQLSRKLIRKRRGGVSVAIAVVMAMAVAIFFINKIIIFGQVLQSEDKDRIDEQLEISSIQWVDNETRLSVAVTNTGSVTAHIVTLYIQPLDPTKSTTRYGIDKGVNFYIDPGITKQVIPENLTLDPDVDQYDDFIVSVHTERGNSNSKTYTMQTSPPYPDWFSESANPLIIIPEESSLTPAGNLDMMIWNRANVDIELDLLVITNIILGDTSASPKVQVLPISAFCIAGEKVRIQDLVLISGGADGARIELVSSHNWVVGQFVFIFP